MGCGCGKQLIVVTKKVKQPPIFRLKSDEIVVKGKIVKKENVQFAGSDPDDQSESINTGGKVVKPPPGIAKKVWQYWRVVSGPKVVKEIFDKRYEKCLHGDEDEPKCPWLRTKSTSEGNKHWCGACGCGYRQAARLDEKLWFARVQCPRVPPLFEAIDEEKEKHLLEKKDAR